MDTSEFLLLGPFKAFILTPLNPKFHRLLTLLLAMTIFLQLCSFLVMSS